MLPLVQQYARPLMPRQSLKQLPFWVASGLLLALPSAGLAAEVGSAMEDNSTVVAVSGRAKTAIAPSSTQWQSFTSEVGRFRVDFPYAVNDTGPEAEADSVFNVLHMFEAIDPQESEAYSVTYADLTEEMAEDDETADLVKQLMLTQMRKEFVADGMNILTEEAVSLSGESQATPGKKFKMFDPNEEMFVTVQLHWVNDRFYILALATMDETTHNWGDRFFNSFEPGLF